MGEWLERCVSWVCSNEKLLKLAPVELNDATNHCREGRSCNIATEAHNGSLSLNALQNLLNALRSIYLCHIRL